MEDSALSSWQVPGSRGAGSRAAPPAPPNPCEGCGAAGACPALGGLRAPCQTHRAAGRPFLSSRVSSAPRWLPEGPGGAAGRDWNQLSEFSPSPGETRRKGQRGHPGVVDTGEAVPAQRDAGAAPPGRRSRDPVPLPIPALPVHLVTFNERGLLCTEARAGRLLYKAALCRGEGEPAPGPAPAFGTRRHLQQRGVRGPRRPGVQRVPECLWGSWWVC